MDAINLKTKNSPELTPKCRSLFLIFCCDGDEMGLREMRGEERERGDIKCRNCRIVPAICMRKDVEGVRREMAAAAEGTAGTQFSDIH